VTSFPHHLPESTATPLTGGPTLRWGVLAPGTIATDFARTIHRNTGQRVHAVASRTIERAQKFARDHGIERAYGDYEQLVADPGIDIVYVAAPHSEHRKLALLAISAGKHVLIEKPIGLNATEARQIAGAARAAGVFAMEAMWSRFLPQTTIVDRLIRDGVLGDIGIVTADFGAAFEYDPTSRAFDPALGGGALLDIGVYPIWFAHFVLEAPMSVAAVGAQALVSTSLFVPTPVAATVSGTLARIEIDTMFVAPSGFTLHSHESDEVLSWQDQSGLHWRDGQHWRDGLAFEATAVAQHVADGLTESPLHPLDRSIAVLETIDEARRQLGITV
jgi:predicted dehydrogenase